MEPGAIGSSPQKEQIGAIDDDADGSQFDRSASHKQGQGRRRRRFRIPLQGVLQTRIRRVLTHD